MLSLEDLFMVYIVYRFNKNNVGKVIMKYEMNYVHVGCSYWLGECFDVG